MLAINDFARGDVVTPSMPKSGAPLSKLIARRSLGTPSATIRWALPTLLPTWAEASRDGQTLQDDDGGLGDD
jgi:hypothetical protein